MPVLFNKRQKAEEEAEQARLAASRPTEAPEGLLAAMSSAIRGDTRSVADVLETPFERVQVRFRRRYASWRRMLSKSFWVV